MNKHELNIKIWLEIECPHCGKINWYFGGNPDNDNLYMRLIEGYECGYCCYRFVDAQKNLTNMYKIDYEKAEPKLIDIII